MSERCERMKERTSKSNTLRVYSFIIGLIVGWAERTKVHQKTKISEKNGGKKNMTTTGQNNKQRMSDKKLWEDGTDHKQSKYENNQFSVECFGK